MALRTCALCIAVRITKKKHILSRLSKRCEATLCALPGAAESQHSVYVLLRLLNELQIHTSLKNTAQMHPQSVELDVGAVYASA
jgi:hypothetical protein